MGGTDRSGSHGRRPSPSEIGRLAGRTERAGPEPPGRKAREKAKGAGVYLRLPGPVRCRSSLPARGPVVDTDA